MTTDADKQPLTISQPSAASDVSGAFVSHARKLLLREYLPRLKRCLEQLTDEQVWWRANEGSNSIGNLLLHLAGNVRQWIVCGLGGESDQRQRDEEFAQRDGLSGDELLRRLTNTLADVDAVLAQLDLSQMLSTRQIQGTEVTALQAIFHVTEHFSMHTGQIILLTKMLSKKDMEFYDFSTGAPVHTWSGNKTE